MKKQIETKLDMKYEFKITDEDGNVFLYDVSRSSSSKRGTVRFKKY